VEERELISKCLLNDRSAQKDLYNSYAPRIFALIKRYIQDTFVAEDILVESFFKIFSRLSQYRETGSFEGWMKRVAVNECLMYLRKNKAFHLTIESDNIVLPFEISVESDIDFEMLSQALDLLPVGYRTVFNLYVMDGFKHKEIAEKLGISVNTSKSQFKLAKERLEKIFKQKKISITG